MKISILTGGGDRPYALGLLAACAQKKIETDYIASDDILDDNYTKNKYVTVYNIRGDQNSSAPVKEKVLRILRYYCKLMLYAIQTDSKLFHILWLNKFILFDRTFLNIFYRFLGKKLVFTAHNVDDRERDGNNNLVNTLTLKFHYKIVDHIFVHTQQMKAQLIDSFRIDKSKVTVIPFGINNTVPKSELDELQARKKLDLCVNDKVILFFGNIAPYKGLDSLISALALLKEKNIRPKLIIAGRIKNCETYWNNIQKIIEQHNLGPYIVKRIEFIPDSEIEIYFKSADALILPYKFIYQSGVLFLSYYFGLPAIATDVGSIKENIIEGETGYVCKPDDSDDLAKTINKYFHSDLYKNLKNNRKKILKFANQKYSWDKIGEITHKVYKDLLQQ